MEINKINNILTNNSIKKQKKIFKSASLTFSDSNEGYLICEEYRHKERKTLLHTIGGKVELSDIDIFYTAIREFIEESNLEQHPIINIINLNKHDLILKLYNIIDKSTYYIDVCVNKQNNFYHRYYLCILNNITDINIQKEIYMLPLYFNNNYKTEINKIVWINNNEKYNKNFSWLTRIFFSFIYKNV